MNEAMGTFSSERFALVTAGHRFLLNALPFREPDSRAALATFAATVERSRLPPADLDAILLRCLTVLDAHGDRRIPSLVDRYLLNAPAPEDALTRFESCILELLRYRCITDGAVQHAIEFILLNFGDSALTPRAIAAAVGRRLSTLDVAFKQQMSCSIREHLRETRLQRSAVLLATTGDSIKEVWTRVGYNHPSNFAHDFKARFGVSSSEFRARCIRPLARWHYGTLESAELRGESVAADDRHAGVLLIDDDPSTTDIIGTYLRREGYTVSVAATGAEGLHQARQRSPRTILLDYRLDDMDGLAVLRALRADRPGDVPAIAVFTADWDVLDQADDIHALNAVIASKLCDIEQIKQLITYLAADVSQPPRTVRAFV